MSFQKSTIWSSVIAIICVVVVVLITLSNVNALTEAVRDRTYSYLHDVSTQSAQVIEERFIGRILSLQLMGNSLAFMEIDDRIGFMSRKMDLTQFETLVFVYKDGSVVMMDKSGGTDIKGTFLEGFEETQIFQQAVNGTTSAGVFGDQVTFMVPIVDSDYVANESDWSITQDVPADEVAGVMIGARSTDSLMQLLVDDTFGGSGFTFLIDQFGEVLVQDSNEFGEQELAEVVSSGLENILRSGNERDKLLPTGAAEFAVDAPSGDTLIMDYQPLSTFGWSVVTAVNEDFLSRVVDSRVTGIITTLAVLIAILVGMIALLLFMEYRYRQRLETVAFVDPLTQGMSFVRFRMLAEPLLEKASAGEYALVTLNVKRFKLINHLGGTEEGDRLLRMVYRVIQNNLHGEDEMVAHGTADNFTILLENTGQDDLTARIRNISDEIARIDTALPVRISTGIYVTGDPNVDFIMFLDRSNSARVSDAKEYNSTWVFYDDNFVKQQEERARMISMIEEGLRKNEFVVYLQPKISPELEKMMGAEALVRWIHPQHGMIGPNVFIPLCEQNGLICDLDLYVFDKVCEHIKDWQNKGWNPMPISVNVSGMHLRDISFVKKYREIADRHEVDTALLELELTESVMFSDLELVAARRVISAIHEQGFRCSMDDFGSGYSALGVLADLPINCIKLDRSFFIDCMDNPRAQTVIATIIRLAQDLLITTVAEGIEEKPQVEMLKNMGCDLIQGFYYSPPLPAKDFAQMAFVKHAIFYKKNG